MELTDLIILILRDRKFGITEAETLKIAEIAIDCLEDEKSLDRVKKFVYAIGVH